MRPVDEKRNPGDELRARALIRAVATCAVRSIRLLVGGRLHVPNSRVGARVELPDGRSFVVFRESTCDADAAQSPVMLAVWFRLRGIPPGALIRRRLFERLCIVNTVLFAGVEGYLVKLWMVDPATSDYAGLYSWASAESAEQYGRYITGVLGPLSRPGSTGFAVFPGRTLDDYLASVR